MNQRLNPSSNLLVVSSDESLCELLQETIELAGGGVTPAGSLKEALLALEEYPFDALISDMRLRDGSGSELIRRIKSCGIEIPSALMIGCDPDLSKLAALAEGAEVVFQKPFGINDFLDGVAELLGNSIPEDSMRETSGLRKVILEVPFVGHQ